MTTLQRLRALPFEIRQYLLVTGNYWAFTLTDGALRMLVVLHFHQLGYSPLEIALLFLFYEAFGVVTNFVGGWLGARLGLNRTMNLGLGLQLVALGMLLVPASALTVPWVMAAQALSGVAKDLNKMSAKSAVKVLVPKDSSNAQGALYRWVAILTGSKNALKGAGFFAGGLLLTLIGFQGAILAMWVMLAVVLGLSLWRLRADLGRQKAKPRFREVFSTSRAVNVLAAARLCLFASRDIWFVVALPVFLYDQHGWNFWSVGILMSVWVIGYGGVQTQAPRITQHLHGDTRSITAVLAAILALLPAVLAFTPLATTTIWLIMGLLAFGVFFAINSSWHSYLIVRFARAEGVSMDVGFYYMANAMGRLIGTVLSGWVYQVYGLAACLGISAALVLTSALLALGLPRESQ
ncbi:organoarsenical effux MFS transporter ArsJ [Chromohalobacter sp. TMW 2.2308]|uniref:Organoarsenical effux MFS transporter ArsJ n=1 Tax=Chromohalobacter moromii TaxID=2860329 RepID=A0A9X2WZQ9_9GAMM|nr:MULTISPECIES: organoarsenical effux MFS transporter ArsJ [Chromohalobacter]MCK2041972.1 organoarsenical effux MFS transporter ArsJ [Chromohalobacter moromii]MCT8503958.1 organoarsenical effux MFS transporter ArsJ [Chromohalobacter moromii]MCT8514120.1 organoarsenical effux MFS transporter ArsJ [Chromohalobacter sp. TMW 2.2271]